MRRGTHPGPTGHPSEEGSFFIPSSEGCRVSGGVGLPTGRTREATPAYGHPSKEGIEHPAPRPFPIPSWEGCRVSGGVGLTARRTREPTPALRATPPRRGAFFSPLLGGDRENRTDNNRRLG